jgi:ATP phosphoribosyltransferase
MSSSEGKLIVALPSKGRLQGQTVQFLSACGFDVRRVGNGRDYVSSFVGLDDVGIVYFRPEEIPSRVEQGDAHTGITGEDLYREYGEGQPASLLLMPKLGFGSARLVVAVPQSWIDVSTVNDLDEAAMLFHQRHGKSLRVATKFMRLTRAFFSECGIVEYSLVESAGATEGAPAAGVADFVVDLTSTGTTLAENHLKEIAGGTVLQTEACVIASMRRDLWNPTAIGALEQIVEQIEARIRATSQLLLRFAIGLGAAPAVESQLTGKYGCILSSASAVGASTPDGRAFVVVLCSKARLHGVVKFLKSVGAGGIAVDRAEFIFEGATQTFDKFRQTLKRSGAIAGGRSLADS